MYSLSLDGPIRQDSGTPGTPSSDGFLAGSRALDSLDKLITSVESFFHPSNYGVWSLNVCKSCISVDIWTNPLIAHSLRPTAYGRIREAMEGRATSILQDPGGALTYASYEPSLITEQSPDPTTDTRDSSQLHLHLTHARPALDVFQGSVHYQLLPSSYAIHGALGAQLGDARDPGAGI